MTTTQTTRFGAVEVRDDRLIDFPEGVPGLSGKKYALIDDAKTPGVVWLQSLVDPAIALCLVDPTELAITYEAQPKPAELRPILAEGDPLSRLTRRVVARDGELPGEIFLNLFAPIFFDFERRIAMQVPLVGSGFSARQPYPPRPVQKEAQVSDE
jgi:flagellar assembly factor FliW